MRQIEGRAERATFITQVGGQPAECHVHGCGYHGWFNGRRTPTDARDANHPSRVVGERVLQAGAGRKSAWRPSRTM
jgi:hypothetical protein